MGPTRFQITGLHDAVDVDINFRGNCAIIVGPNGIGKSTVANVFYFLITRQWNRISEYKFSNIALWFEDDAIEISRDEITGLSRIEEMLTKLNPNSRTYEILLKLRQEDKLDSFLADFRRSRRLLPGWRDKLSDDLTADEFRHFVLSLSRRMESEDGELMSIPKRNVEAQLDRHMPGRTLYLPTYRRIEKGLREIAPEFGKKFAHVLPDIEESMEWTRSSKYYVDLVSFGMNDVRKRLDDATRALRDFSLEKFNNLSGIYLRDVIRGQADDDDLSEIRDLNDSSLDTILARVSENVLTKNDKELLRTKVRSIRESTADELSIHDRYLAHYFSRLVVVNKEISERETDLLAFIDTCNKYLAPQKSFDYDDIAFTSRVIDSNFRPLDMSLLSSGEKQVVSVFAHLFLDNESVQTVVIDEPELSLSVPWQKRFLSDILRSGKCSFLLAVTHSPFVYQNDLKPFSIDLRRHMRQLEVD